MSTVLKKVIDGTFDENELQNSFIIEENKESEGEDPFIEHANCITLKAKYLSESAGLGYSLAMKISEAIGNQDFWLSMHRLHHNPSQRAKMLESTLESKPSHSTDPKPGVHAVLPNPSNLYPLLPDNEPTIRLLLRLSLHVDDTADHVQRPLATLGDPSDDELDSAQTDAELLVHEFEQQRHEG